MNHHTQNEVMAEESKSFFNEFGMYGVGLAIVTSFVLLITT
ncbi:hypothetical protein FIU87_16485 [Bacillus sp. THAF10]|nr:hypothetical protein [Bacillus sp. THAF10]QFT90263.1 hypothetical protein FIU87_16485 [Bacillus sp. THAF10]